jgi:hypothetical protein
MAFSSGFRLMMWIYLAFFLTIAADAVAQERSAEDLAAAAQNPVANMISLPFQNNTLFGMGPDNDTANVLNIQPVIPVNFGDWNLINRTIAPLIYLPDIAQGTESLAGGDSGSGTFGLGDINHSVYVSPARPGKVIWGIGPSITVPTATDRDLGTGKWSAGPAAVALTTPNPWVIGVLARQLWSFAGDGDRKDVSQLLVQPFINYNLANGWYLVSAPIITANWEADSDNRWLVPLGGGAGKLFKVGKQPINTNLQGYYNVERPSFGPDWSLRFQVQFLFPK